MDLGKAFGGKIRKFLFLVPEAGMALSAISTGAYQGTYIKDMSRSGLASKCAEKNEGNEAIGTVDCCELMRHLSPRFSKKIGI